MNDTFLSSATEYELVAECRRRGIWYESNGPLLKELETTNVDHPKHYRPGTYEAINVIEAWQLGFHLGNVVKYIARCGLKGAGAEQAIEDLKKARWYLDRRIAQAEEDLRKLAAAGE